MCIYISVYIYVCVCVYVCMCVCIYIYIYIYIKCSFFIHSSVDGHLGCFHVQFLIRNMFWFFLDEYLRVELLAVYYVYVYLSRKLKNCFPGGCTIFCCSSEWEFKFPCIFVNTWHSHSFKIQYIRRVVVFYCGFNLCFPGD